MQRPPDRRISRSKVTQRRKIVGLIVLAAGAGLVFFGSGFYQFSSEAQKYCGVRTTDDRSEVLYRLGYPSSVLDDSQKNFKYPGRRSYETNRKDAEDPDKAMPAGKTVSDYYEWSYLLRNGSNASANVYVDFDRTTKGVDNIDCVDFSDLQHLCPALVGVMVGDPEERVRDKLGRPDRYELDGVTKTLSYDGVGVEFKLTKGSVYYLRLVRSNERSQIQVFIVYVRSLLL